MDVQDGGDDLRVQGVVLRHEDVLVRQGVLAGPARVAGSLSAVALGAVRLVAGRREVQIDDEGAARSQLAFHGDGASHKIDEVLRDGHAEARSLNLVGEARLLAGERVEDGGKVVLRHADAVVADDDAQMLQLSMALGGAVDAEEDVAALGRVLHGVGEQVHEDLAQPPLVADEPVVLDLVHFHGKHLVFGVGLLAHHGLDGFHGAGEGEGACCQGGLAGLDLRHVQHVVDEPQKVLAGGGDLAVVVAHVGGVVGLAVDERGEAQDGVHGRADVVAHGGEERAFGAVGVLGGGGGALEAGADLVVGGDVGEREDGLLALGEHHGPRRHAQPLRAAQRRVVRLEFPGARLIAGAGVHDGGHVGVGLVGRQLVGDEEVAGRNAEDVLGVFEDGLDQALLAVDDEDGGVDVGADGRVHALDVLLVAMLAAAPVHHESHHGRRRQGHGHGKHGHHLVGDADDLGAVGFHHRKRQDGHERPAALGVDGGVENELVGAVEGHDEAARGVGGDAGEQRCDLGRVSVVVDEGGQAALDRLVGAAVGVEHNGAGGVDDEGGAGAGIGGAVGVLQLVGGVGDVDGAENVVGIGGGVVPGPEATGSSTMGA